MCKLLGDKIAIRQYQQASDRLRNYDRQAGQPGWDSNQSDRLEQEKYEASRNIPWWRR